MKQKAKSGAGGIEKFEDRSRELFLNLRRSAPISCQAPSTNHLYPSDGQAANAGREPLTNSHKGPVH